MPSTSGPLYNLVTDYPYNVGKYHRKITTKSSDAQVWFDRGLSWLYGFNLEEAAACFDHALKCDDACPMAAWGFAYASGPHYNFQWQSQGPDARRETVAKTHALAQRADEIAKTNKDITPVETALVGAIRARYPHGEPPEKVEDFGEWNRGYADAMQKVYEQFSDDLDVACLYADAMINLTPWRIWDIETGEPARGARAHETKAVLEKAFTQPGSEKHGGLLHIYIHLMEMSPTPELAVPMANNLRDLSPDNGHLQHMASHIDVLVGAYDLATKSNEDAVAVDRKWLSRNNMGLYTNYAVHNITSLVFAAMMAGNLQSALGGCDRLEELVTDPFLRMKEPNMGDFAESFLSTRPHVLIRFGKWKEILDMPLPHDPELYTVTIATLHYAKGIAHAAQGQVSEAEEQLKLFRAAYKKVSPNRLNFPNKSRNVLAVAEVMLLGELEYRKGGPENIQAAFAHLDEAIKLEDKLMYSEPPGWMLPTRHATAALLLEQNHVRKAAELYAEDLGLAFDGEESKLPRPRRHPGNMWALHGFHECLTKLGMQGEAEKVARELKHAKRGADIEINSSCFCRLDDGEANGVTKCHL